MDLPNYMYSCINFLILNVQLFRYEQNLRCVVHEVRTNKRFVRTTSYGKSGSKGSVSVGRSVKSRPNWVVMITVVGSKIVVDAQ